MKLCKRARPYDENIKEQEKKIKVEPTEAPLLPATTHGLDREKLKRLVFSIEKEYNQITFGLKIVREHMGGMMRRIQELDGILKNSEK